MRVLSFKKEEKSQRIEFQQAEGEFLQKRGILKTQKTHAKHCEHTKKKIEKKRNNAEKAHKSEENT